MGSSDYFCKIIIISVSLLLSACKGEDTQLENTSNSNPSIETKHIKTTKPKISGIVDSSLIDRNAQNTVYVYKGKHNRNFKPDNATSPITIAPVVQTPGTCQWTYEIESLSPGEYTLVFARQQQFTKIETIKLQDDPLSKDFTASNIISVGPERVIKTPSAAAQIANPGDVIEIDGGNYIDDIAVWRANNIFIRGISHDKKDRPHIHMSKPIPFIKGNDQANGMGIWVLKADNVSVENIEFSGAKVPHKNGAGLRIDNAVNTTVCNSYFHHNENGLLGGGGTLLVEYSEFSENGFGNGYTHNIYVNQQATTLIFQYNYTHNAQVGHNLKTRAKINYILYNRIMDEREGRSSYLVDVSNGGLTYMIGNILQQGRNTINKTTAVAYGLEGIKKDYSAKLFFINNTVVNNLSSGYSLKLSVTAQGSLFNNLFLGGGTMVNRQVVQSNNLQAGLQEVMDASGFNYHLTEKSKAIDAGKVLGDGDSFDLMPKYEYVNTISKKKRIILGNTIDIGAYEYYPIGAYPH